MKLPIDRNAFSEFIRQSDIFGTTRKAMERCLKTGTVMIGSSLLMICGQTWRR